jgi:type IV secretory pathway component VirB8
LKARINGNDDSGYNPRLKKLVIEVVEKQMKDNNPPITNITFHRLIADGYTEQAAKEKIAAVVVGHIYDAMKYNKPFDEEKYAKELSKLK